MRQLSLAPHVLSPQRLPSASPSTPTTRTGTGRATAPRNRSPPPPAPATASSATTAAPAGAPPGRVDSCADPMQKRLIAAAAAARLHHQILGQRRPAPGLELVEADHAAQHPVDRPRRQPRRLLRQHHDVLGRPPRPRRELAQLHHPDPIPAKPALAQERPERPQVVRVRLDRVRRALTIGQPRQVLVDQLDRPQIRADDRERLTARAGRNTRRTMNRGSRSLTSWTCKTRRT